MEQKNGCSEDHTSGLKKNPLTIMFYPDLPLQLIHSEFSGYFNLKNKLLLSVFNYCNFFETRLVYTN